MSDINRLCLEVFALNPKNQYKDGPIDPIKQNHDMKRSGEKPKNKEIKYKSQYNFFKSKKKTKNRG